MTETPTPAPVQALTADNPYWSHDHLKTLTKAQLLDYCETVQSLTVNAGHVSYMMDRRQELEKKHDGLVDQLDEMALDGERLTKERDEQKKIASDLFDECARLQKEAAANRREVQTLKSAMRIYASKGRRS